MRKRFVWFIVVLIVLALFYFCKDFDQSQTYPPFKNESKFSQLKGPYLDQEPPGLTSEVFAPNLISRGFHELGIAISSEGNEIFYIMSDRGYQHYALVYVRKVDGIWSKPQLAEFARDMSVYTCFFAPHGKTFYFSTNQPVVHESDTLKGVRNWFVEKKEDVWQTAKPLEAPLNVETNDRIHAISKFNNLYLTRKLSNGNTDIFISLWIDGQFQKPRPLNGSVNSNSGEGRPFIAPDESFLLFHSDREKGVGSNDLWISFKDRNNAWCTPVNLGENINTESSEFGPVLSPDGKYLFFSSYRPFNPETLKGRSYDELLELYNSPQNGYATLYWVDAKILEGLKSQD